MVEAVKSRQSPELEDHKNAHRAGHINRHYDPGCTPQPLPVSEILDTRHGGLRSPQPVEAEFLRRQNQNDGDQRAGTANPLRHAAP